MAESRCAVCGAKGQLKQCAGCKHVYYCSVDHQKSDWKKHKAACKSSQISGDVNKKAAETGQMRARLRQMMLSDPAYQRGHQHDADDHHGDHHDHSQCGHDHHGDGTGHGHSRAHAHAASHEHDENCSHEHDHEEPQEEHVHGPGCNHDHDEEPVAAEHVHGPGCDHDGPSHHHQRVYPYIIPFFRRTAQPLLRIADFQIDGVRALPPAQANEIVQYANYNSKSKNMPLFVLMHSVNRNRGGTFEADVFFVPMVADANAGRFVLPPLSPDPQMAGAAKEREATLLRNLQQLQPEDMLVTFEYATRHNVLGKAPPVRLHVPGNRRWLNLHTIGMNVAWRGKVYRYEFATIHFYAAGYFQMLFDFVFAHLGITDGVETGAVTASTLPLKTVQVWAYASQVNQLAIEALGVQQPVAAAPSELDRAASAALNDVVARLAQTYGLHQFNFEFIPEGYPFPAAVVEKPAQSLRLFVYPPDSGAFSGER